MQIKKSLVCLSVLATLASFGASASEVSDYVQSVKTVLERAKLDMTDLPIKVVSVKGEGEKLSVKYKMNGTVSSKDEAEFKQALIDTNCGDPLVSSLLSKGLVQESIIETQKRTFTVIVNSKSCGGNVAQPSREKLLVSAGAAKRLLPYTFQDGSKMTDISVEGDNTLVYTIVDDNSFKTSAISEELFAEKACGETISKNVLNSGVSMKYHVTKTDGSPVRDFVINADKCKK